MSGIVVLSGAGLSAESGLGTFRDLGGIWSQVRLEEVATPVAFAADPDRVHAFYNARRAQAAAAAPNPAHVALARLQADYAGEVCLVTQNVDGLLERAGARDVIHMHGALDRALCAHCGATSAAAGALSTADRCETCGHVGGMRPDVVWFGEIPKHLDRIERALATAALFVSVGTSGQVWPAAGFVATARASGARTMELNLDPTDTPEFDRTVAGPASATVPDLVGRLLENGIAGVCGTTR